MIVLFNNSPPSVPVHLTLPKGNCYAINLNEFRHQESPDKVLHSDAFSETSFFHDFTVFRRVDEKLFGHCFMSEFSLRILKIRALRKC